MITMYHGRLQQKPKITVTEWKRQEEAQFMRQTGRKLYRYYLVPMVNPFVSGLRTERNRVTGDHASMAKHRADCEKWTERQREIWESEHPDLLAADHLPHSLVK